MTFPTQLYRDYFINREIRIPFLTIQDSMESRGPRVFWTVAHVMFLSKVLASSTWPASVCKFLTLPSSKIIKKNWVKILHIFKPSWFTKKKWSGGRVPNMILPFSVTSLWFTQSYTVHKRYSSYKPPPKIHGCRLVTVSRLHMLRQEETKRCIKHP